MARLFNGTSDAASVAVDLSSYSTIRAPRSAARTEMETAYGR